MKSRFHEFEKFGGLYIIRNLLNGWVYIGSARHFKGRYRSHL